MSEQDVAAAPSFYTPQPPGASFSEDQFLDACHEVGRLRARPESTWQLLAEAAGVSIYRVLDQKSGLYEYKIYGGIAGCSPELCAEVYMDLKHRPTWDRYAKELCEKTHEDRTVIYWEVKFPFPLWNRDYVFIRERRDLEIDGRKVLIILAKSVSTPQFPEKTGVIRVRNYRQSIAVESDGTNGSKVYMSYFDDPGGMVPPWFVNWVAKTAVPNFLKDMRKACLRYHKKR
ncbi:phosphatidylcholine transfer protein [Paroedura picta]|uniref:phosphatidylcholine transfer protein n=1 Tax=Paroedura picta TaxID=143630 RepID=UPI00405747C5